jgi:imidazolonepropionase-like amidohydrolase
MLERRTMILTSSILALIFSAALCAAQNTTPNIAGSAAQPIVLQTSLLLDGKGNTLRDTQIVVEDGKITGVGSGKNAGAPVGVATYDLRGLTVLPGWVDAHVHITWHFGPNDRAADPTETPQQSTLAAAGNAYATLMAGFTTVQSLGAPADKELRNAIARAVVPGPRILTSLDPLTDGKLTPDQIRDFVRRHKEQGADVIKIFASKSIRDGGGQTLTQEQLDAACGEAKQQGLRSAVHAYRTAIRAATLAGCTEIEHGTFATDDDLKLMAERGTWFDPQVRLVIQNYLDYKTRYLGIGNYTEAGFEQMRQALPLNADLFKRALATPGLKVIFGTDAVAGAHGRNAEELIYRVQDAGEQPMHAMVSATSMAAAALGLQEQVGVIAPGMQADIIALDGNPLDDITAVRRVVFVMKGGRVYKNEAARTKK